VTFELPVVLPPPGRYVVRLEPPWSGEPLPGGPNRPAEAVIDAGGDVLLEGLPGALPAPGERVRVVFSA
jgi:hypothetical protein